MRDKAGTEVGQVRAQQLRGQNLVAVVQTAGEQQGLVEELTNFGNQRKRAPGAGVSTGARGDCNQAIDTGFSRFFRMAPSGHVVEHQAAVTVDRIYQLFHRAKAGDQDGHLMVDADRQVGLQSRIALVHDQVDRIGRRVGHGASPLRSPRARP